MTDEGNTSTGHPVPSNMPPTATRHVEFGMYPFESVAWAWDELWAAIHERVPWTPPELTRSGDVHARWNDPDCVVTHVCGRPFAMNHRDDMYLVGAFALDIPEAVRPGYYRSVLMSPDDTTIPELLNSRGRAVANGADSLSGWHSLIAATVGSGNEWPGPVTYTGAHHESLRALAAGQGDLAVIDSWSLALITEEEPELVADLHRIGVGPVIPTPAVTARKTLSESEVDDVRAAFSDAVADPSIGRALGALHINGFVPHSLDPYLTTMMLGPSPFS